MSKGKKYLVLGLGVSGRAAVEYLLDSGEEVVAIDDNLSFDEELLLLQSCGAHFVACGDESLLDNVERVVKSPGIAESHPLVVAARERKLPLIGEIELVADKLHNSRCIAITGTNGKTTVTLMVEHILRSCGYRAAACGNIGLPITTLLKRGVCDLFVVEVSSFQLETMESKIFDVALITNITPDHLDRHGSFENYRKAKLRSFSLLKEGGVAIAHRSIEIDREGILFYGANGGEIDRENEEAAAAVCKRLGLDDGEIKNALSTFKKPPHRLEFVCRAGGVAFYNDSKGTNIDAVEKAVAAMRGEVILIAGGVHKGEPYSSWRESFVGKVKLILAIGQAAFKIAEELGSAIETLPCHSLDEAVAYAATIAKPGDNILLSPGCSSYDMFRNYQHRGEEFVRIVHETCASTLAEELSRPT